jgi:very-short-patch-repair endonuclease
VVNQFARQLRVNMTVAERILWKALRNRQCGGLKFRRQISFGPYVLDFHCQELHLAIEVDGGQHTEEKDAERTAWFAERGIRLLRFWNNDVVTNLPGVLDTIAAQARSSHPPGEGQGERAPCPTPVSI